MAKHKSPFSEAVYKEWESLAFPKGELDPDEARRRWANLYRRTRSNNAWTVNSYDAGLVASRGARLAIEDKRWADAAKLCTEFLAHPDAGADDVTHDHHFVLLGCMTILLGDATTGAKMLLDPLYQEKRPRLYFLELRACLLSMLGELDDVSPPNPTITNLVSVTIRQFRDKKRTSQAALRADSYRELLELLRSTFPPRPKSTELP
ncbi:MAG: hypothetical protein IH944_01925 [Armatimonadetes bacterium]|nr:hypothetical protein [Armatimonadota bacterium]